jgi:hypothetical protein
MHFLYCLSKMLKQRAQQSTYLVHLYVRLAEAANSINHLFKFIIVKLKPMNTPIPNDQPEECVNAATAWTSDSRGFHVARVKAVGEL